MKVINLNAVKELSIAEGQTVGQRYPYGSPSCMATAAIRDNGTVYRYTCTRPEHTDGPHVAHVPGLDAVAMWSANEQGSVMAELAIALFMVASIIAAGLVAAGQARGLVQQVVAVVGLGQ